MFDIPIHPVVVHFPLVLAAFLPLAVLGALWSGLRFGKGRKYWIIVVVVNALLFGSSFLAVQAGEKDEETVEDVLLSKVPLETHSDKAEFFLVLTGGALLVTTMGLVPGILGMSGKILGGLASLWILLLGLQVGHTGGALVYKHGAASAFVAGKTTGSPGYSPHIGKAKEKDDD